MDRTAAEQRWIEVRGAWGEWLEGHPWDWYATMTFAEPVHPEQAGKRWARWIRDLEKRERCGVRWARALEWQKRQVIHYHALVWFGGREQGHRLTSMKRWEEIGQGFSRVVTYDPARGAGYYLGKYVAKGGEVDLGGAWWSKKVVALGKP